MSTTFLGNLGGQIQKKFYVYFIKKVLGSWIKNPPNMNDVNVLENELNLSYLEFESSLIDQHIQQYPFKVLSAYLENLKIPSISWNNITNLKTYFSVDKLCLILLIEEPTIQPINTFIKLKESIYTLEQDFTKSIYQNQDTYSEKGIKSIATIIRDILYNVKFQIDLIEIQLKSDVNQSNPLIIQLKNINVNQQSTLHVESNEAWKYLKFNINILIDNQIIFQNTESPITFNYEINKGKISVSIPKISACISAQHLEKIIDLSNLYQEFSTFQNQSQMSLGMYFGSENNLRSFIDLDTEEVDINFVELFQEKVEIIEINTFELKIISVDINNYLHISLNAFKLKDLRLNNTFNLNIKEIINSKEQIILLNNNPFDFSLRPSKQNPKHYKLDIENKNTIINFDFEIINRYISYFTLQNQRSYNIDPDPLKCILNMKLIDLKINLFAPEKENYLQIQTNKLLMKVDPFEIKFDDFNLCLVVGENEPKIIYKSEFLRLAIQKKSIDISSQIMTHPNLFSENPILINRFGSYYHPTDQAGFQHFNSLIYPKVSLRILVLFGKTHLLIKEKNVLSYLYQLISGISSLKFNFPPPSRFEYTVIDVKWKEFFIILESSFIVKLLCFSVQSTLNFYTNQKYHYLRLEDGCIYNPRTEEVVLEKVDHRNPFLFVASFQSDFFPKNDIQTSKIGILFEGVRIHHFLSNRFWILEFIDYFNFNESVNESTIKTLNSIYISCKSLDMNLIVNKNYNLTLNGIDVKISFRPHLELILCDQLVANIFNQITTIPILKINNLTYHHGNLESTSVSVSESVSESVSVSVLESPLILIENIEFSVCSDSLDTTHKIITIISDNQKEHDKYPVQTLNDIDVHERNEIKLLMMDALSSDDFPVDNVMNNSINNSINTPHKPCVLYYINSDKISSKLLVDKSITIDKIEEVGGSINCKDKELLEFIPVNLDVKRKKEIKTLINALVLEINKVKLMFYSGSDWIHQRNTNIYLELLLDGIKIVKMKSPEVDDFMEIELALSDATLSGSLDEKKNRVFFQKMPHISKRLTSYNSTRSHFNASKSQPFHIHFRKDIQEYYLELSFFPARLDINQNLINFIVDFIQNYSSHNTNDTISEDNIHFKSIKINQMYFRINYASNLFDCKFKNHHWMLNFLSLRKLDLMFNDYYIDDIYGTHDIIKHLSDHYLEVIGQQKQIKIIKSITPLRSIIRLANGIVNLVIIPSKECYQSGKVVKGFKNGLTNFKETTLDELRAIGHKTFDMISNTIELFEPTHHSTECQDAVIEIPYRDYNQKGILKAIQSYLKPS
jgi:hypothetical protein